MVSIFYLINTQSNNKENIPSYNITHSKNQPNRFLDFSLPNSTQKKESQYISNTKNINCNVPDETFKKIDPKVCDSLFISSVFSQSNLFSTKNLTKILDENKISQGNVISVPNSKSFIESLDNKEISDQKMNSFIFKSLEASQHQNLNNSESKDLHRPNLD